MKYEDGIYDISDNSYHGSDGYSRSQLLAFEKSPAHFRYELDNKKRKPPTAAMILGSLFHCLLLEPEQMGKKFATMPDINRRTKVGKEEYEKFVKDNVAKAVISQDQLALANEMADSVMSDKNVAQMLSNTTVEQSLFFTHQTGQQYKSRPDAYKNGHIIDIKTANDVGTRHMTNECIYRGYFLQAGMIYEAFKALGKEFTTYTIIACEKDAPYLPKVFQLNDDCIEWGVQKFNEIAQEIKICAENNVWPAYTTELLELPRWLEGDL